MMKHVKVLEERADPPPNSDIPKKLAKNVSECLVKVNNIIPSARSVSALFTPQAITARMRLRDVCERAIMTEPTSQKQFMEEIWRKVYYEPFSATKNLRKDGTWSSTETGWIWTHLNEGVAYYQQFLLTIASNNEEENADFLLHPFPDDDSLLLSKNSKLSSVHNELFFRSLTCLGDLTRYLLDIPNQISLHRTYPLCVRYYHQALHYNRGSGLTHNNLATVYSSNNQPLLATIHYLRGLTCEKPFSVADGNLKRMLEKSRLWLKNQKQEKKEEENDADNFKGTKLQNDSLKFLHSCLSLVSYFVKNEKADDVSVLCQKVLVQLGKLLDDYDSDPPDVSESSLEGERVQVNGHTEINNKKSQDLASNTSLSLTPESMVVLSGVFIICSQRLSNNGSPHSSMSEVLIVSILLTLVSHINTRLEQRFSLVDPSLMEKLLPKEEPEDSCIPTENKDKTICNGAEEKSNKKNGRGKRLSKLRRRKCYNRDEEMNGCDSDDSLDEYIEEDTLSLSNSEEEESALDAYILCSSEDDLESDDDVKIESEQEWDGITALEHLQLIGQEGMLASVYITLDWLSRSKEMIKLCAKNAPNLWLSLAKLFNLTQIDTIQLMNGSVSFKKIFVSMLECAQKKKMDDGAEEISQCEELLKSLSLPEDLMLHLAIPSLRTQSSDISLKDVEISLLRLLRINSIINSLSSMEETPLKYEGNKFIVSKDFLLQNTKNEKGKSSSVTPPDSQDASFSNKLDDQLSQHSSPAPTPQGLNKITPSMHALTAQWLQHEVRTLEERTSGRAILGGLYLVPDAAALIDSLASLKLILTKPSHMVIIPQIVIDSLDVQKRESLGARDAIRWLEVKLRHGSRFIRAQRPHEKTHLPLIKYPKRKDKEAWEWFQMAECCYYLGAQPHHSSASQPKAPVVVLLTGKSEKLPQLSFSAQTLVAAAGAKLQSVEDFLRKWQTSTKGHS